MYKLGVYDYLVAASKTLDDFFYRELEVCWRQCKEKYIGNRYQ